MTPGHVLTHLWTHTHQALGEFSLCLNLLPLPTLGQMTNISKFALGGRNKFQKNEP